MPTCFLCKKTVTSVNGLFMHFDFKHHASSFTVFKCGENECYRKWSSRNSLRKHLLGPNHNFPAWSTVNLENTCERRDTQLFNECINQNNTNNSDISLEEITDLPTITLTEFESIVEDRSNAFVAKLYNKPSIPRNHIQSIIDDTTFMMSSYVSIVKEKVFSHLNTLASDNETIKDIKSMFDCLQNPFNHLKNEYQRITYFKSSGNYIAPIKYYMGKRRVRKNTGTFIAEKVKDICGYFIPLKQVLKQFFELPDAFNATINYINSLKESDSVKNFIQSKLWCQKKNNFEKDAIVLPLFVYYDDWEVNNPLGSHSASLGGVYCYVLMFTTRMCISIRKYFFSLPV